jgi:predicted Zn-dependent protease
VQDAIDLDELRPRDSGSRHLPNASGRKSSSRIGDRRLESLEVEVGAPSWMRARAEGHADVSDQIPTEFRMYQRAIVHMRRVEIDEAIAGLEALLNLSPDKRHFRSTWAAYMIGMLEEEPSKRTAAFQRVQTLTADGFADTLGLAAASWRHLASSTAAVGDHAQALEHCGMYMAAGGRLGCVEYLEWTVESGGVPTRIRPRICLRYRL